MADPSLAEIEDQWKKAVDVIETSRVDFDTNLVPNIGTLEEAFEGDYTPGGLSAWARQMRAQASAMVDSFSARLMLEPLVFEYGKLIKSPHRDASRIWGDIYAYMHANSKAVKSRAITYASPSADGSNTGNGRCERLTVDEKGYNLEACHVELKTLKCVSDQTTGAVRHAEVFDLYGVEAPKDALDRVNAGSGRRLQGIVSKHAGGGGSRLLNGSFTTYNASGTTTTMFRGWTIDTIANVTQATGAGNTYRGHPGDGGTLGSLRFNGAAKLTQTIEAMGLRLNPSLPYRLRLMYNREVGTGDGTLTIRMGSTTKSVVLAAQTGWNELILDMGTGLWPANWYEDQCNIEIELASRTTGYVLVDDAILAPLDFFDGTFLWLTGGATPWQLDDFWSWTDTGGAAADAKLQYYAWLAGFGYLPSATGGSITWADPT